MRKVIREVDEKRGVFQFTCADERYYLKSRLNPETGIPEYLPVPSVTWIVDYWPNKQLELWRAEKGIDEAEAIKKAAGDKGSAVHLVIEKILNGEEFRIDTKVVDKNRSSDTELFERELTYEELVAVQSFIDWFKETKPETISTERTVFSAIHGYAGTVDYICRIEGVPYVIDFKTSKAVQRGHAMQVSAYRVALENGENPIEDENGKMVDLSGLKTAILQVGYDRNKDGYKFTEVENAFPQFKIAQSIWKEEHTSKKNGEMLMPGFTKREFPIVLAPGKKVLSDEERQTDELIASTGHGFMAASEDPLFSEQPIEELPVKKSRKKAA